MRWGRTAVLGCAALVLALAGCGEDELAPPAPGSDGSTGGGGPPIGSGRDGGDGSDGDRPDGALPDGGLPLGCVEITDDDDNEVTVEAVASTDGGTAPAFAPDRAYFKWNPDSCDTPEAERRLLAALTEGQCLTGLGKRLVFSLQADQVGTGIAPGTQSVSLSSFLGVLFVEPRPGEADNELWSNIADSSGDVTIEEVGDAPGDSFRATFNFRLPNADDTPDPALRFNGSIDVTLEQPFDEVCRGAADGGV